MIQLNFEHIDGIEPHSLRDETLQAQELLESGSGAGSDFLGWRDLPHSTSQELLEKILKAAGQIQKSELLVVVGIGGSYLGTRAVLEALQSSPFQNQELPVYFAGHQMDGPYHRDLLAFLQKRRYAVNIISKSGTTTEPALAFRLLWDDLGRRFDNETIRQLVFVTTDAHRGGLRRLADQQGLTSFSVPDNVGGRFSVLTPVGLLPIAAAKKNIEALLAGAAKMRDSIREKKFEDNPALLYAAFRNACYRAGKKIEILVSYQSNLHFLCEWWKQLFGESEGKEGRGIFPATALCSSDLHSLGQWMQEGERSIFETVLDIETLESPSIPFQQGDVDGFNWLAGKKLHAVNRIATEATLAAHHDGQVPCLRFILPNLSEESLGALLYLFQYACGLSAYILQVNPFDQPGVEAYKKNMFRLLGRPAGR